MTIKEVSEKYDIPADTLRYHEKVGVIPPVTRTAGGIRNYSDEDIGWVENAICMRRAGLSVEFLIEYLKLYQQGDGTLEARLKLLCEQREILLTQQKQMETTMNKLKCNYYRKLILFPMGQRSWKRVVTFIIWYSETYGGGCF